MDVDGCIWTNIWRQLRISLVSKQKQSYFKLGLGAGEWSGERLTLVEPLTF